MVDSMKKVLNNNHGQAIFEFILFLPILLFLYLIMYNVGNSISGSINQQKAVRGYFYYLVKHNSFLLTQPEMESYELAAGIKWVGFNGIGWRDKEEGNGTKNYGPCFAFPNFISNAAPESCNASERPGEEMSTTIRTFTYYGVCGPIISLPVKPGTATPTSKTYEFDQRNQSHPMGCQLRMTNAL